MTIKAGCILIDVEKRRVALVFRDYYDDYSFPKGHLEKGEKIEECAIRETAEETKRVAKIVDGVEPFVEKYTTPKGEECESYLFVATDGGKSNNTSWDTHPVVWVPFDEVEDRLSYENLKQIWKAAHKVVENICGI